MQYVKMTKEIAKKEIEELLKKYSLEEKIKILKIAGNLCQKIRKELKREDKR